MQNLCCCHAIKAHEKSSPRVVGMLLTTSARAVYQKQDHSCSRLPTRQIKLLGYFVALYVLQHS